MANLVNTLSGGLGSRNPSLYCRIEFRTNNSVYEKTLGKIPSSHLIDMYVCMYVYIISIQIYNDKQLFRKLREN